MAKPTTMTEYLGMEANFYGRSAYIAVCDRTKGITVKLLDSDRNVVCINRQQFMARREEYMSYGVRNRQWHEYFTACLDNILSPSISNILASAVEPTIRIEKCTPYGDPFADAFTCAVG